MADQDRALLDEVLAGASTMAALAQDEEVFRAAVDAFRAYDGESMAKLLEHYQLAEHCEAVCHWLRSNEAVVLCLELAGPPPLEDDQPDPRELAELTAKLTSDEASLRLMVDAVQDRNASAWRELLDRHGIHRYSHFLCHWVCTVHYRLVCHVVCSPILLPRPDLGPELQIAGAAVGRLAADDGTFAEASKAVLAGRCEALGSILELGGHTSYCHFVCEWFCTWRCTRVCLRFCLIYPFEKLESPLSAIREFALAGGKLERTQLERLTAAFLRDDDDQVQSLIKEWQFERFCILFCHWVCYLRCHRFCVCVCPPRTTGVFTKIGKYFYDTEIHSHPGTANPGHTGLTVADARAFYSILRLNGGMSLVDGAPLIEYRFQTRPTNEFGAAPTPPVWNAVTPDQIAPTNIGSFDRFNFATWTLETIEVWVNKSTAPGVFGIAPDPDGWIKVPPMFPGPSMVPGTGWRFVPGADLINLITTKLNPATVKVVDETGVVAGKQAKSPNTDVHFGIRMCIRDQSDTSDGVPAGTCEHIAINNTRYDKVSHHPYWPGGLFGASNELAVSSIGIDQLKAAACSTLANQVTVRYTAAHSHVGKVKVWLEGPSPTPPPPIPGAFTLIPAPGSSADNQYGEAVPDGWTFASLPPCAYMVKLGVEVMLTDGDREPGTLVDSIAFCKAPRRPTK